MSIINDDLLENLNRLVKDCIKADRRSQGKLYEMFMPKMFAICLRYTKNREEAEEVLQEGFVQIFRSLHNFTFSGSIEGWMRKIMVYSAIKQYRRKSKLHPVVDINAIHIESTGLEDAFTRLGKKELLKMVQALPPGYRIVFNLYVFEGLKHREIAEQLDISEGTSKSNLSDAKAILQQAVANSLKIYKSY